MFRLVTEAFHGPQPGPHYVPDHLNGIKTDDRASNLEWVTRSENQLRAARMHKHRGEGHANAKLTEAQVLEIRTRYRGVFGEQTALAKEYSVSQALISKIVRGEVWPHVGGRTVAGSTHVGEEHGRSKLTPETVRVLRRCYDSNTVTMRELADTYDVTRQTVRDIVRRKTWKHIT